MRKYRTIDSAEISRRKCKAAKESHPPKNKRTGVVHCEGYMRLKKRNSISWATRYVVLRNFEMRFFDSREDSLSRRKALAIVHFTDGQVTAKVDQGIEFSTQEDKHFTARLFSRGDLAQWVTAFYRLQMNGEVHRRSNSDRVSVKDEVDRPQKRHSVGNPVIQEHDQLTRKRAVTGGEERHVSFFGSVMVRQIPAIADDQVPELFYSKAEFEKFSERASTFVGRTEEAVNTAYLSFRTPSILRRKRST